MKSSLWNFIYGLSPGAQDFDLEESVWSLQTWPIEMIEWPVEIDQRLDILISPYP
jgi:hypothetical protein